LTGRCAQCTTPQQTTIILPIKVTSNNPTSTLFLMAMAHRTDSDESSQGPALSKARKWGLGQSKEEARPQVVAAWWRNKMGVVVEMKKIQNRLWWPMAVHKQALVQTKRLFKKKQQQREA
jgi:hypothetical protein